MESKPSKASSVGGEAGWLLIEPVWNRNMDGEMDYQREIALLIEPVWNRNCFPHESIHNSCFSFNRTSMESKLLSFTGKGTSLDTFNRTSMESKRLIYSPKKVYSMALLIEPVWNRNR